VSIDTTTIAALATWAVALGTVALLWWQAHVARQLNSANAVMELRERFDAPRMRRARRQLSERLLAGKHEDITNLEVAAFFELIGALAHRRVLDRELVWEAFGTWTTGYYHALRHPVDVIGRARQELKDPLIMHEFQWLYQVTRNMDHGFVHGPPLLEEAEHEEARVLLRREAELDVE
jgi:hypothetical protein